MRGQERSFGFPKIGIHSVNNPHEGSGGVDPVFDLSRLVNKPHEGSGGERLYFDTVAEIQ